MVGLEACAADCRVYGRIDLGEARMTDLLSLTPELLIRDARLESLAVGDPREWHAQVTRNGSPRPVVPAKVSRAGPRLQGMGAIIDLTDGEWGLVADLFDPEIRRGAPEVYPRRRMVEAMLWMARTGIQ